MPAAAVMSRILIYTAMDIMSAVWLWVTSALGTKIELAFGRRNKRPASGTGGRQT